MMREYTPNVLIFRMHENSLGGEFSAQKIVQNNFLVLGNGVWALTFPTK